MPFFLLLSPGKLQLSKHNSRTFLGTRHCRHTPGSGGGTNCWLKSVSSQAAFHGFCCMSGQVVFKKNQKGEDEVKNYMDGTQPRTCTTLLTAHPLGAECKWWHTAPPLLCAQVWGEDSLYGSLKFSYKELLQKDGALKWMQENRHCDEYLLCIHRRGQVKQITSSQHPRTAHSMGLESHGLHPYLQLAVQYSNLKLWALL